MRILYHPTVNRIARHVLKPVVDWLPARLQFPVTGKISVEIGLDERIVLRANPTSNVARLLFWKGARGFEPNLTRVFEHLVPDSKTFLDVGANIGYYSLLTAALRRDVKVYAFEPMPSVFQYLSDNLRLNSASNVHAIPIGLSSASGPATLHVPVNPKFAHLDDSLTGMGSLSDDVAAVRGEIRDVTVETTTLDEFVETHLPHARIDLIKIDTEGTEDHVLRGGEKCLDRSKPTVICEVLEDVIERELEEIFRRHGYVAYRADVNGLTPVEDLMRYANTPDEHIFVHASKIERVEGILSTTAG